MPTNDARRDEIRKILLSLLLARPGATPITILDRDYYEVEGERIPWRKFGYADVAEFLKSMPEHFVIEWCNGGHYVRGIASEKTKHVSSLVSRQKSTSKSKYIAPRIHRPFINRYIPQMQRQRVRIPAEQLSYLVTIVQDNPNGVYLRDALAILQKQLPYVMLSLYDLREQLRELPHSLYLDCDMIYPVNNVSREAKNYPQPPTSEPQPPTSEPQNMPRSSAMETTYVAGDEGSDFLEDLIDDDSFVPVKYLNSNHPKQSKTSERLAASFARNASNEQNAMSNHNDDVDDDEYFAATNNSDNPKTMTADYIDLSSLISNRTKSRLDQLVQKHSEGIWCADLPDKYLKEYNINLNYIELGFTSVREYVSYLPDIFYMTRADSTDDFLLYSADKRPTVPDQEVARSESIEIIPSSREQHDEHNAVRTQHDNDDDNAPIPADVSPTITKAFAPDDVMNYNDSVDLILVTDLQRDRKYLEIYVVELFNPTFFWIHLRENKKRFDRFMNELHTFYEYNKDKYTIPKIALKKGLNCACIYASKWHRAIIRSVKPDFRVTVMFYDYGTLKTYAPEDVYYLHKQFSFLPAQAIPCGLYNVKPCVGDRWKKSVTVKLYDKISEALLALTIVSVDPPNNSMMVVLSDTSEEEDVHINDWLIKEKLAQCGKMVCMCDSFLYFHYLTCNNINIQSPLSTSVTYVKTFDIKNDIVNVDKARHDRNQSIPCNKRAHTLFDVKSENNMKSESKTVEALHNIPSSKKALLQKLRDINSLDAESSAAKSQSIDYSKNEKPSGPRKLLEKLRALNVTSNSNLSISAPKPNHDFKDNVQQINSDMKTDSQDDNGNFKHCALNMDFGLRDSDNEENIEKDFGTFRSLYGGHGSMEPFDWSLIKKNDHFLHQATVTSHNNLDILIKEYKNNVTEDESELHKLNNLKKESLPANPYFLNITRKEEEYYLPEQNINYDFKNVSQSVAKLRNRMEVYNDKYTTVVVTRDILEMCNNIQSQNILNPDTNTVQTNGVASSIKETTQSKIINENGEAYETKTERKIEKNRDFDADMKSISSNMINNKDLRINKKTFECSTDSSSESNTINKVCNPRYKKLLDQIRHMKMNSVKSSTSMDFLNTRNSPSSEQIQSSSCSHSSSTTGSTISSDDEQREDFKNQNSVRFTKLRNFSKLSSTSSSDFSLDCNSKETRGLLSSENDSLASLNVDDFKRDQLVKIDAIASNVDDSKQPNVTVKASRTSKMLELVLKNVENATSVIELDSDDLSNQESVASDKSYNMEGSELVDELVVDRVKYKSSNDISLSEKTLSPPVLNDCDMESDESDWDGYVEPLLQFRYTEPTEISDDESERI